VSIVYSPEKQVVALGENALAILGKLRTVVVTTPKQLESASETINFAGDVLDEMAEVRDALATRVKDAFEPYKRFAFFAGAEINITLKIPMKQQLETAYQAGKTRRAQYLDMERLRLQREQLAKQAEQDRINKKAADDAAAAAKKAGADKATVAEIKQAVLATPAPIVESKAANVAEAQNVSLRYNYTAQITDLSRFLAYAIANKVMLNTLAVATPELEKAFRKMATDQKEQFQYPGITFKKTPVDVSR
jgi:hypothetical protein